MIAKHTRPTEALKRTTEVLQKFRQLAKSKGLGVESLWRDINDNYLHEDDHIAIFTVMRLYKNHKQPIRVSGETVLAIQEWNQNNASISNEGETATAQ